MIPLHPLLNRVTVFSPPVLLTGTLWMAMPTDLQTPLPMTPRMWVSLLGAIVSKRAKLKRATLVLRQEFVRRMRLFSILCRVVRSRRAVARPWVTVTWHLPLIRVARRLFIPMTLSLSM